MKLEINLADREEIAAAVPLLQLILDGTGTKACGGQSGHTGAHAAPATPSPTAAQVAEYRDAHNVTMNDAKKALYEEFKQAQTADLAKNIESFVTRTQVPEGETFYTSQMSPIVSDHVSINTAPVPDPAAVFGGTSPAPLAPSIPPAPVPATSVPPAPGNTAPIMPTLGGASSGAAASSVDLDNRGLPWDSRIHSSSKAKLANGQWKNARGKAPEYVAQIEAELRNQMTTPVLTVAADPASPSSPAVPSAALRAEAEATRAIIHAVAPSADPTTFEQLMTRFTAAVTAGSVPVTAMNDACLANGLNSVVALQQSPQFVPHVWAMLKQQYPALV